MRLERLPWAAIAAGICAAAFLLAQVWIQQGWLAAGPANDFANLYAAAEGGARPYLRPPVHAAVFAPLRLLPYPAAYLLWQVLMLWCVAGFVAWWRPPSRAATLFWTALSGGLFFAFVRGQDTPLLLLAAAGCVREARRDRAFRAGLWLSAMALVQPATLLAAPVALAARRSRRLLQGWAAGMASLLGLSFALAGWGWPRRLAAAWTAPGVALESMPNLAGAAAWLGADGRVAAPAAVLFLLALYELSRRESFAVSVGATLATSALLAPVAYLEDIALLLPVSLVLLAEKQAPPVRFLAALLLTPLPFVLQGGGQAFPAAVLLGGSTLALAAAAPSGLHRTHAPLQLGLR